MTRKKNPISAISERALRAMSYPSREARFRQEKDQYLREHPFAPADQVDEVIRTLADKWRV